ncbi:MAG TPA: hypothetical protein VD995_33345 [Azospirillum sp.]|nr:hypothetical protein [Azospirillum sp.]
MHCGNSHFGNASIYAAVQEPHRTLSIIAESEVAVTAPPPLATPPREDVRDRLDGLSGPEDAAEVVQFAFDSALVRVSPELAAYAAPSFPAGRPADLTSLRWPGAATTTVSSRCRAGVEPVGW